MVMFRSTIKLQKNKNVTLPMWLIRRFGIGPGDFLQLRETREGVLLKPGKLIDPSQAYFWTKEWQKGEREADEDIRSGRTHGPFGSVQEMKRHFKKLGR